MKRLLPLFLLVIASSAVNAAGPHSPLTAHDLIAPTCSLNTPNIQPPNCVDYNHVLKRVPVCSSANPHVLPPNCSAPDEPDLAKTPGAAFDLTLEQICADGYEATVPAIPNAIFHQATVNYGFPFKRAVGPCAGGGCVADQLIPVGLGGNNTLANIWPQPVGGTWTKAKKDELESILRKRVCELQTNGYQYVQFSALSGAGASTGLVNDVAATPGTWSQPFTAPTTASSLTALSDGQPFSMTVKVGAAGLDQVVTVNGATGQTIADLIAAINPQLTGVQAAFVATGNGAIVLTTVGTGNAATITVTANTLIGGLPNLDTPVIVNGQNTVVTTYTASVLVGSTAKPISIAGGAAQTFTNLVSELNTDLGASATATLDATNKRIKITATTATDTIVITPGTLFAAPLANFSSLSTSYVGHPAKLLMSTARGAITGNWKGSYNTYVVQQQ